RRHFEDLHLRGGADLVVAQVAGDEQRIALLDPDRAAVLELEVDPALHDVNELAVTLVVVPAGRPAHALARRHDLGTERAGAGIARLEVAVFEEIAPSLDQLGFSSAGV